MNKESKCNLSNLYSEMVTSNNTLECYHRVGGVFYNDHQYDLYEADDDNDIAIAPGIIVDEESGFVLYYWDDPEIELHDYFEWSKSLKFNKQNNPRFISYKKCEGEGLGSCSMCGLISWMCFLYKISGMGCTYCSSCVKKIIRRLVDE